MMKLALFLFMVNLSVAVADISSRPKSRSYGKLIDDFNEMHEMEFGWLYQYNLPANMSLQDHYAMVNEELMGSSHDN